MNETCNCASLPESMSWCWHITKTIMVFLRSFAKPGGPITHDLLAWPTHLPVPFSSTTTKCKDGLVGAGSIHGLPHYWNTKTGGTASFCCWFWTHTTNTTKREATLAWSLRGNWNVFEIVELFQVQKVRNSWYERTLNYVWSIPHLLDRMTINSYVIIHQCLI